MVLPTKGVEPNRALLAVGAEVLVLLEEPKTLSRVWEEIRILRQTKGMTTALGFDWFILALDLLYALGAIEYRRGKLSRRPRRKRAAVS